MYGNESETVFWQQPEWCVCVCVRECEADMSKYCIEIEP